MKSIKLSIIIDIFFIFISSLFFFYAIILYSGNSFTVSIIISTLIAIILSMLYIIISSVKKSAKENKTLYDEEILNFNYTLIFMSNEEINKLILNLLNKNKVKHNKTENSICLTEEKYELFTLISPEPINSLNLLEVYNKTQKEYTPVVLCIELSKSAEEFINKTLLNIKQYKTNVFYEHLKKENLLPSLISLKNKSTKNFKLLFSKLYNRKNAKKFLFTGVILIIMSFFTFYPIYYIVLGSTLMILAVVIRLFAKAN